MDGKNDGRAARRASPATGALHRAGAEFGGDCGGHGHSGKLGQEPADACTTPAERKAGNSDGGEEAWLNRMTTRITIASWTKCWTPCSPPIPQRTLVPGWKRAFWLI